jgi:uncharacterized Zn finger protein
VRQNDVLEFREMSLRFKCSDCGGSGFTSVFLERKRPRLFSRLSSAVVTLACERCGQIHSLTLLNDGLVSGVNVTESKETIENEL